MKVLAIIGGVLSAIVIIVLLAFCATGAAQFSPDVMLHKYEYFKDAYTKIQSAEMNIKVASARITEFKNTYGSPKDWTWETKDEYNRLSSTKQGYIGLYNSLVQDYNAQSSKFNWKLFKTSLPQTCVEYMEK
jgi:hypothetical protein